MNDLEVLTAWHPADVDAPVDAESNAFAALERQMTATEPSAGRRIGARALIAAAVTTVLVVGGVVVAARIVDDGLDGVRKVRVGALDATAPGAPMNVLVLGSDSRAFVENGEQERAFGSQAADGGSRSDTMILVRVAGDSVTAVWLPRDLMIPDASGTLVPLNSFADDGPAAAVDAVRRLTGEQIDHYVEVDFPGFVRIVDDLGGVRMWVPAPMRDSYSGLDVAAAGCTTFDGATTLAWARSRHAQFLVDGTWTDASPRADLDRITRQQQLLRAIGLQTRTRIGASAARAESVLDTVAKSLVVDDGMDRDTIRSFVGHLLRPEEFTAVTAPNEPDAQPGRLHLQTRPAGEDFFGWATAGLGSGTSVSHGPPPAGTSC